MKTKFILIIEFSVNLYLTFNNDDNILKVKALHTYLQLLCSFILTKVIQVEVQIQVRFFNGSNLLNFENPSALYLTNLSLWAFCCQVSGLWAHKKIFRLILSRAELMISIQNSIFASPAPTQDPLTFERLVPPESYAYF